MTLEELLLRHAAGEDVSEIQRQDGASGVMMIPIHHEGVYEGVEGLESALLTTGVTGIAITAKAGQKLEPLPEGASYLGFIFSQGAMTEDVEQSLRVAQAKLRFQIAATLPIMRA